MIAMRKIAHAFAIVAILLSVPVSAAATVGVYLLVLHLAAPTPKHFRPQPVHRVVTVKLTAT